MNIEMNDNVIWKKVTFYKLTDIFCDTTFYIHQEKKIEYIYSQQPAINSQKDYGK